MCNENKNVYVLVSPNDSSYYVKGLSRDDKASVALIPAYTPHPEDVREFDAESALEFLEEHGPHPVLNITSIKQRAAEMLADKMYGAVEDLNEAIGAVQVVERQEWAEVIGFDHYTDNAVATLKHAVSELEATMKQLLDGTYEGELDYSLV